EAVAKSLADTEGVPELTQEHWDVVNYLRDYYQKFNMAIKYSPLIFLVNNY
ncbi:MAG: TusE/DsrC/DsvC family sulfur relay protein, partial [Fibrobacteria bacterium]|nr:TusE/DsrC/DsvC family sulfur relay protein [Fibrobacteria bacterium]